MFRKSARCPRRFTFVEILTTFDILFFFVDLPVDNTGPDRA